MAGSRQSAVLDMISQGEYDYACTLSTAQSFTANSIVPQNLSDNGSGTSDMVVSWVRCKVWGPQSVTLDTLCTVAVYKLLPGGSDPTWNTAAIQELRDTGRLFFLKSQWQPKASVAGAKQFDFEFYNVKLRVGEKLRLALLVKTTGTDYVYSYLVEKRELRVGVA